MAQNPVQCTTGFYRAINKFRCEASVQRRQSGFVQAFGQGKVCISARLENVLQYSQRQ